MSCKIEKERGYINSGSSAPLKERKKKGGGESAYGCGDVNYVVSVKELSRR